MPALFKRARTFLSIARLAFGGKNSGRGFGRVDRFVHGYYLPLFRRYHSQLFPGNGFNTSGSLQMFDAKANGIVSLDKIALP
ncbi:MAG: hypothetical protein Kow0099_11140 [Candidatus Abyssubacteria bacterium]